jgi:hypothetical protein
MLASAPIMGVSICEGVGGLMVVAANSGTAQTNTKTTSNFFTSLNLLFNFLKFYDEKKSLSMLFYKVQGLFK